MTTVYYVRLWGLEWDYDCDVPPPPETWEGVVSAPSKADAEHAAYRAAETQFGAVIDSGKGNFEITVVHDEESAVDGETFDRIPEILEKKS